MKPRHKLGGCEGDIVDPRLYRREAHGREPGESVRQRADEAVRLSERESAIDPTLPCCSARSAS